MSMDNPRRYGNKVQVGGDLGSLLGGAISLGDLSNAELDALDRLAAARAEATAEAAPAAETIDAPPDGESDSAEDSTADC